MKDYIKPSKEVQAQLDFDKKADRIANIVGFLSLIIITAMMTNALLGA